jgi:hypothetical protein
MGGKVAHERVRLFAVPADPLVSVLLPVWNGERFLAAAIDSITAQTFRALELIVIDDGSTDRSLAIARELAARDPRVVVLPRPRRGLTEALNAGIAAARGSLLARMDADDLAVPTRLAQQVAYLDAHPRCVVVGGAVEVVDDAGRRLGVTRFPTAHGDIVAALVGGRSGLAHPAVLMRHDAVAAVGGYRASTFPSEDLDLWLRLRDLGEFANLDEPLLRYRRHPSAVGVRERGRQLATTRALVAASRAARGERAPVRLHLGSASGSTSAYHFECARIALRGGEQRTALRHACGAIASAPGWMPPYAVLAACFVPTRAVSVLARLFTRIAGV